MAANQEGEVPLKDALQNVDVLDELPLPDEQVLQLHHNTIISICSTVV